MAVARLFDEQGRRLFFTEEERQAFIAAANQAPDTVRTICHLLHYTGCNFTDAINMTPQQVDFVNSAICFQDEKASLHYGTRAVPVPESFIELIDQVHDLRLAHLGPRGSERIWPITKKVMLAKVNRVIAAAAIARGPHATARGIRFGFLVHAIRNRILLTRIGTWMGYSDILYLGKHARDLTLHAPELLPDERADAALMW